MSSPSVPLNHLPFRTLPLSHFGVPASLMTTCSAIRNRMLASRRYLSDSSPTWIAVEGRGGRWRGLGLLGMNLSPTGSRILLRWLIFTARRLSLRPDGASKRKSSIELNALYTIHHTPVYRGESRNRESYHTPYVTEIRSPAMRASGCPCASVPIQVSLFLPDTIETE